MGTIASAFPPFDLAAQRCAAPLLFFGPAVERSIVAQGRFPHRFSDQCGDAPRALEYGEIPEDSALTLAQPLWRR
jgi:hypothetical protein